MLFFLAASNGRLELTHPSTYTSLFIFPTFKIPGIAVDAMIASYIFTLSFFVNIFSSPFLSFVAIIFRGIFVSPIFLFLNRFFNRSFAFLYSILPWRYFISNKS